MKTGILAAIAATSLIVASCSDSSGSGSSIKTISLTRGETELMAEQTSFSTNLFNEAAKIRTAILSYPPSAPLARWE